MEGIIIAAVIEYENRDGKRKTRIWRINGEITFKALIKFYVLDHGKLKVVEKPSTRPATFSECYRFANKLKAEYGRNLKQIVVWNMDVLESIQEKMEGL